MVLRASTILGFLTLVLPFVTANQWSRRHQEVAHRARGDIDVHKRQSFTNARFTFYDVGLGACGQTNVASDWIVALNVDQYGSGYPGPYCFKSITIQYGGKTASATIMDECMGCPWGGLDFSRGLFDYFASESEGVLYGTWWFADGAGQTTSTWTPPSTTWEPPAPTSTPDYTPPAPPTSSTPDYTPPPTTSSTPAYTPPPTTTTTSSTSSTSSTHSTSSTSSSINLDTGLISGLAIATTAPSATSLSDTQNLPVINDIVVDLGLLLVAAVKNG